MDREAVVEQLQPLLVELTDLALTGKQAHWNVTGPQFLSVHELLDTLVDDARVWSDEVAERLLAIGSPADGRASTVVGDSPFPEWPAGRVPTDKAIGLIVERLEQTITASRQRIEALDDSDLVSQDLVIAVVAGLEKYQWMFSAQQN
jgi:starvation-inducible DNA-binding protein